MAAVTIHTAEAPSGERYDVRAGVMCLQVKLGDPLLSALIVIIVVINLYSAQSLSL